MSFSNEVKSEICSSLSGQRHCLLAEMTAIMMNSGRIDKSDCGTYLYLDTDQHLLATRFLRLMKKAFGYQMQITVRGKGVGRRKRYQLKLQSQKEVHTVMKELCLMEASGKLYEQDIIAEKKIIQSYCCQRAFLSGAFLARGTMITPEKHYRMEYICGGLNQAWQLSDIMYKFGIEPNIIKRKKHHIIYIKEGSQVGDLLTVMQAMRSLLEYENVRVTREIRGNVNRKVNCETANLNKTISAALSQVRDIELIRDTIGLNGLSEELYQTAMMRLQHRDTALKELGMMMDPPVGKSGMNHRLKKIHQIANDLKGNKEE